MGEVGPAAADPRGASGGASGGVLEGAGLYDMHLHLDWMADVGAFVREMGELGLGALGCTVTPAGYDMLAPLVADAPEVRAGLGLHPWYLGRPDVAGGVDLPLDGTLAREQVEAFCERAREARFIGEVGLDFGKAHGADKPVQLAAFRRICEAVRPGSVLSIHAVRSVDAALEVLGETGRLGDCACVFHWFSGTSEELARARKAGCRFSVGPFMLKSKRGREYARQIPERSLLLETDLPEGRGSELRPSELRGSLEAALLQVAQLKGADPQALAERLARSSRQLLG